MNSTPQRQQRRGRASALVITLAFIIILTILILTFFNIVTMDRLATRNYAQGLKAETVALGAMDFVIGQLRSEMEQGGGRLNVGNYGIYTNVTSTNILPQRSGSNTDNPVLIKAPGDAGGMFTNAVAVASSADSAQASANNRRIPTGRWTRPMLGSVSQAPRWFLLGPAGITDAPSPSVEGRFAVTVYDVGSLLDINVAGFPSTLASAQKKALAGTLAGLELTDLGLTQAQVDELITGFRNRASSADYTNHVLNVAATNGFLRVETGDDTFLGRQDFLAYAKQKGFTNAATNFTTFTRALNSPAWSPATNAADFNIQKITRSSIVAWNPQSGASTTMQPANVRYRDDATSSTSTNRAIPSQAVTVAFTRQDGSEAVVGEPLMTRKFPLSRLAWLSKDGPSQKARQFFGGDARAVAGIKAAFGLVWDSVNRLWVYTSPSSGNGGGTYSSGNSDGPASSGKAASTIKTLDVVASEGREPDFFELLQAGILKGSLGQHSSIVNPNGAPQPGEVTSQGHIFQIGANIIDQYDEDDYPTLIRAYMPAVMDGSQHAYDNPTTTLFVTGEGSNALTPHDFAGVENIPYLMSLRTRAFRPQVGNSADGARRHAHGILLPQFWNPHKNASSSSAEHPSRFRVIQTFGDIRIWYSGVKRGSTEGTVFTDAESGDSWGYKGYVTSPPSAWPSSTGAAQPMIEFSGTADFAQPGFLAPSQVTDTSRPENIQPAIIADAHTWADIDPTGFVGFWLGSVPAPGTAIEATDPLYEDEDNTAIDYSVWSKLTGRPKQECPVHQSILYIGLSVTRNATALPAGASFWKGDSKMAAYGRRFPVFELQYLDGSVWKTYQRFDGVLRGSSADQKWDTYRDPSFKGDYPGNFISESFACTYGHIDPRTSRFGLMGITDTASNGNGDPHLFRNVPMSGALGVVGRPNGESSVNFNGTLLPGNQGGAEFTNTFDPSNETTRWKSYPVYEWQNNAASGQRYTDNDRILRRGDGDTGNGVDVLSSGTTARPIILNRPFQTPGDLGYVFRDLPFKTLDFFSANSADAGLLDLFCIDEAPSVVAGRLNLNGRNVDVMKQVLEGGVVDETTQAALSSSQADSIANALVSASKDSPFTGLWSLPGFLGSTNYRSAVSGNLRQVKTQAETVSRRLASVTESRCWNLLIDIVAQTGRYAPGVTNPDRFTVEGERRYWLQVAIDRFTGEVVSRQMEPVYE